MPEIFYGWWVVGACLLITFYVVGTVHYGFTALFEPIHNEFGWSYTQISLAASLRGMEMGLLSPVMGLLADRWGPRRLVFGGAFLTGFGLMLLSYTTSLAMFYCSFALLAVGVSACVGAVPATAVANWFHKKIGIAMGIMSCGIGVGGLLVPATVRLIDIFGWRMAILVMGAGMWAIAMPLSLLLRHKPERYGYLPDGEAIDGTATTDKDPLATQTEEVDIATKQAIKSSTFWHMTIPLACHLLIVSAITTHVMPYLSSVSIARSTASLVASAIMLISITGRLGSGWLGDRLAKKWVTAGNFAAMSLGLLFFAYAAAERMWLLAPFLLFFCTAYGGNNPMSTAMIREYFGRSKIGTINGLMMGIMSLGSILGPLTAGWVFDNWGSYRIIWLVFVCLAVAALIGVATTPPVSAKARLSGNTK